MASVIKDPGGLKRIQWSVGGGERKTLRLGNVTQRQADAVRVRIEQLLASKSTGVLDTEASRWVEGLDDDLHKKLARLGLVPSRERCGATLKGLLDSVWSTLAVKPGTKRTYQQTRDGMETFFGASTALEAFTPLLCDQWKQSMRDAELADATVAKRVKTARQFFKQAIRWKMVTENPLVDVKAGATTNRSRMVFVSKEMTQKVLDACPDAEWRLIVTMSRYGGVRIPSEIMPLTWSDVDFEKGLVHITSCKTEGYEGRDRRTLPMFPELRAALMDVYEEAEEGTELVFTKHRLVSGNLRTQMHRIIKRAGMTPWPKPFHNLRSSRQTELTSDFPTHVVCAWLGNSITVAMSHYLQVRDSDYARAIEGAGASATTLARAATTDEAGRGGGTVAVGGTVGNVGQTGASVASAA